MKKILISFLFCNAFFWAFPQQAICQQGKEVKALPTCLDFSDVYSRTVLGTAPASEEEEREMQSLASIMMGYVSALQDIYGNRLVGMSATDNEWTLLEKVDQFCRQYPHLTFQRAVRAVPRLIYNKESSPPHVRILENPHFLKKKCRKVCRKARKGVPLHPQSGKQPVAERKRDH